MSRLCAEIDERVNAFLTPPLEGDWPYLWIDATYVKVRQAGRIVSVAVIIAVAVNTDGVREIVGVAVGPSEAEPFWLEFLRDLTRRGLRGVKLVISDAHLGLKAAIAKVFNATWQRCRVHFMRNALAYANKGQRQMVLALINTAFAQETTESAHEQWRVVADHFRTKLPKLAVLLDEAANDVLAFMGFPRAHRKQIASTNPLERLNAEIKRRTDVVGIFPNDPAITRLIGALLLEQNDEWQLQRRYLSLEGLGAISDNHNQRLVALVIFLRALDLERYALDCGLKRTCWRIRRGRSRDVHVRMVKVEDMDLDAVALERLVIRDISAEVAGAQICEHPSEQRAPGWSR